jgi:hypothetical protein
MKGQDHNSTESLTMKLVALNGGAKSIEPVNQLSYQRGEWGLEFEYGFVYLTVLLHRIIFTVNSTTIVELSDSSAVDTFYLGLFSNLAAHNI